MKKLEGFFSGSRCQVSESGDFPTIFRHAELFEAEIKETQNQ
jgi:hypothetical protein